MFETCIQKSAQGQGEAVSQVLSSQQMPATLLRTALCCAIPGAACSVSLPLRPPSLAAAATAQFHHDQAGLALSTHAITHSL